MNYFFFILLQVFMSSVLFGQSSSKNVTIKGTFKNAVNKTLKVNGIPELDSVKIDDEGNFSLETNKLKKPITASVLISKGFGIQLFLAPGYNLSINADVTNEDSFYQTVQMSGIGSETNNYWKQFHMLYKNLPTFGSEDWYNIPATQFVKERLKKPNLDSFALEVSKNIFGKENNDPGKDYFKKILLEDLTWANPRQLFQYSMWNDVPAATVDSFISQGISPGLLVSDDKYIDNNLYKEVMSFGYLEHLYEKALSKDKSVLENPINAKLKIADSLYTGKTKDYVFQRFIYFEARGTFSTVDLDVMKHYASKINNKTAKKEVIDHIEGRRMDIKGYAKNMPAPIFSLNDLTGKKHSLEDYKGKVVYIDLWASWCGPCKSEMPYLKEIHTEYKDKNIEFISIAINDVPGRKFRMDFIDELQLTWLQLEDENNFVKKNYKVSTIPRFILIDKEGRIIDYDAPPPGDKNALKKALDLALLE